ncbi:hypothetical protein AA0120_g8901 [Alternaria tenuissima]|nr:hypothetical protein AA0120_g8901 [Alternaria tenuissima]
MRGLSFLTLGLVLCVEAATISKDARCGAPGKGTSCLNSKWGSCCSQYGWCGSTKDYCETGCQVGFGSCKKAPISSTKPTVSTATGLAPSASPKQPISKNARCGAGFGGQTCQGSKWGNCCSQYFYVRYLSNLLIISRNLRKLTCAVRQQL